MSARLKPHSENREPSEPGEQAARLRVLWLIKGLGPGGAEHLLIASARTRNRDRFDVSAAYLLPWKSALVERITDLGVPVDCLNVKDERDVRWLVRLRSRLRDQPVDVVHVHSPYAAAMVRLVAKTLPAATRPVVVSTEHNAWTGFKAPTRIANAATAWMDAATIAVSQETKDSMSPRQRARCEVLVHGVDIAEVAGAAEARDATRAEFGIGPTTVVVGTVANYHPKKDWPNLLNAARLLADRGHDVQFLLVGQGPLQAEVEALHEQLNLQGKVHLTGFRPDAVRVMAGCDVFTLASQWEGLPVAVMEALALGLPIVATAVGGVAETFTDGTDAILVPSGDASALADALERVVIDEGLRAKLAAAARTRANEFDAARAQRRIEAIYEEVVRSARSRRGTR